jgi:hypothetical protein
MKPLNPDTSMERFRSVAAELEPFQLSEQDRSETPGHVCARYDALELMVTRILFQAALVPHNPLVPGILDIVEQGALQAHEDVLELTEHDT